MQMKIQVIGLGTVGTAQAYLCKRLGHDVIGYDIRLDHHPYCNANKSIEDADITFICTPESEVGHVIEYLAKADIGGIIVVKSTVPVGATKELMERFGIHICHNPEFLREKYSIEDVINPSRIVIGACCPEHGKKISDFYEPIRKDERHIYIVDQVTSEIIKLVSNSLRAVSITFWNEITILCEEKKVDVKKVSEICDTSKVIGEWEGGNWGTKFFGVPYDGKCLPKDIRHLISTFREIGQNPKLFEACEDFNNKLMKNERGE